MRDEVYFGGAFGWEVLECVKCHFFVETEAEVCGDFAPCIYLLLLDGRILCHCGVTEVFHGSAKEENHEEAKDRERKQVHDRAL